MSGHSKWSTIKHKKGVNDSQRGKLFSQLSKNIRIAVKEGKSGDPKFNATLRLALEKARMANMPKENIQRAIDRGLGKGKGGAIQEVVYEAFGPYGVGIIIVSQTDNLQRTAGELRALLHKAGGSLSGPGSVMYLFSHAGAHHEEEYQVVLPLEITDVEQQEKIQELLEKLRAQEDVEDVYMTATWESSEE